jgi:DnaJ family protein C protein 3
MRHHRYLIACVLPFLFPYTVFGDKSTQQYLSEGNDFLTSGEFNSALISFDAAIRKLPYMKLKKVIGLKYSFIGNEPNNYLTYFKRATAYLSLGRNNAAADDFTTILNLKPDFDKALIQRARIYLKEGEFKLAIRDLEKYISNHAKDKEAENMVRIKFDPSFFFEGILIPMLNSSSVLRKLLKVQ